MKNRIRTAVFAALCCLAGCQRACFAENLATCARSCCHTGVKVFTDGRCECQPERP